MVTQTKSRRNQNAPVSQDTGDQPVVVNPKHDVPAPKTIRTGMDLLAAARPTNRMLAKQQLLTEVNQKLAEISDISADYDPQTGLNSRAAELSNSVGYRLFHGQVSGLLTADEVTETLGNQFGWRKKGDAKVRAANVADRSKTPYGYGETIRKRITRAVKAQLFATNPDWQPDNFFRPFEREEVAEMLAEVENNGKSIFTLYNNLDAERKAIIAEQDDDGTTKPSNPAFDPKKVLKQIQALTEEGAIDQFAANVSLVIAYASLTEAVEHITEGLMKRDDAESIIAAIQAAPQLEAEPA